MATPADLAQVGREAFAMIDLLWGCQQTPINSSVYYSTESPLVAERIRHARVLSQETVHNHAQQQYPHRPSRTIRLSELSRCQVYGRPAKQAAPVRVEGGSGTIDCNKAATLYGGKAAIDYFYGGL